MNIIEKIDAKIPMEDNPKKLEILRKEYKTALQEIEKDGELKTDLTGMVHWYLDSYSDYLNNPLLEDMDRLETEIEKLSHPGLVRSVKCNMATIKEPPQVGFVISNKCNIRIVCEILGGEKIPHSTSYPVVYCENGKYYLASFVFFFTREDIEAGKVDRPTVWAIADIETGEIIEKRQTKDNDFSDAPYDKKYNIRPDGKYDTSREYYDKAFLILDSARKKIINGEVFPEEEYKRYLKAILANVPKEYQRFYTDLSV